MAQTLVFPKFRAFDYGGNSLAGGKVYTYVSGTSTNKTTYSDIEKTTPNANPVILDARGEAEIYLEGVYKIVLRDANDVLQWTLDPVTGQGAASSGEYFLSNFNDIADAAATLNALNVDVSLIIDTDSVMDESVSFDEEVTIIGVPGNTITTTGYTFTTSGPLVASPSMFDGTGTVTLNGTLQANDYVVFDNASMTVNMPRSIEINALWFNGADLGIQLTNAITSGGSALSWRTVYVPNGSHTISTPVDGTGLSGASLSYAKFDFKNSYISLETTGEPAFDFIGSAMLEFVGGTLNGDNTNTPSSGFLFGPDATRTNSIQIKLDNVKVLGHFSKAAITAIGVAPLDILNGTTLENQDGEALSLTRRNSGSEVSVYSTINASLPQDSVSLYCDRGSVMGGADGVSAIQMEGDVNHFHIINSYLKSYHLNAPYLDIDCTTESMSYNIDLINNRTEYTTEPANAITITGANTARLNISGGSLRTSNNIVYAPDVSSLKANIGWPEPTIFGSGRDIDVKDVDSMTINMQTGINSIRIDGTISNGIYAIGNVASGPDGSGIYWDLDEATNPDRVYFVDTQNTQYYEWKEEFDFGPSATDIASWPGIFWSRSGTNSADADVTLGAYAGGGASLVAAGADNDSTSIYGPDYIYSEKGIIFETEIKLSSATDVYAAVGLTEDSYNVGSTEDDDCALITFDSDNDTNWHLTTNNNGAGLEHTDLGVAASDSITKFKIIALDQADVRVFIDDVEIDISGADISATALFRPYLMVQTLEAAGASKSIICYYMKSKQQR
jgi:hypothetical protein